MTYFVGIDWADCKHDVCVLDQAGAILAEFIISDDNTGYERLNRYLHTLQDVCLLLERPNGLLVDFLLQNHWPTYFIPPNISAAHRPRRGKTDRGDAYLLASLMRQDHPDCRLIIRHSPLWQQLRQVVSGHDKLQRELQRVALQLRYHLKQYYPAVLAVFRKTQQPITYAFLETFPDPHQVTQVTLPELCAFFTARRYRYMERVATHWELLRKERPTLLVTTGHQLHTAALVAVAKVIDQQLRGLRRELGRLFRQHPDATWLRSLPGLGELNAARLLARLGDNRASFKSVDVLRATAGTVPITRSSGKRHAVLFRRECSHPLRKTFYDLAMKSKRYSPWAKSYFESQITRGHARARANRALANRWVGIVWKLWQTRAMYDEAVHQANRQKAMSLLLAS
jgi:transposase